MHGNTNYDFKKAFIITLVIVTSRYSNKLVKERLN